MSTNLKEYAVFQSTYITHGIYTINHPKHYGWATSKEKLPLGTTRIIGGVLMKVEACVNHGFFISKYVCQWVPIDEVKCIPKSVWIMGLLGFNKNVIKYDLNLRDKNDPT